MTAYSKGAKLKAKRGRPILQADLSTREPNGRPSRRKARALELEQQIKHVAVSRRIRQFGLVDNKVETAEKQAEDPRHGYLLGRMFMDGTINAGQHEAGMKYAEDMARYFGLTGVAFPSARAQDLFAVRSTGGEDSQSKADAARTARYKMVKLREVLLGTADIDTGRRIDHTVRMVCVEDIDHLRTLNPPMKAWLVRGLNALAKFYEVR
jgi:hypothetical protein